MTSKEKETCKRLLAELDGKMREMSACYERLRRHCETLIASPEERSREEPDPLLLSLTALLTPLEPYLTVDSIQPSLRALLTEEYSDDHSRRMQTLLRKKLTAADARVRYRRGPLQLNAVAWLIVRLQEAGLLCADARTLADALLPQKDGPADFRQQMLDYLYQGRRRPRTPAEGTLSQWIETHARPPRTKKS